MSETLSTILAIICTVAIFGFIAFIQDKKAKEIAKCRLIANDYPYKKMYWDMNFHDVVEIKKRSPDVLKILDFHESHELYVNNTPDKLIYTGATVGGVTTGGFHVQKGGISVSTGAGTGKWFVSHEYASTINNKPWPDTVSYMVLSEQLFSEAQKNPYLKELIVPKEAREKWRGSRNDLADNQYLLNVVSMDKHTADCLKSWLAG